MMTILRPIAVTPRRREALVQVRKDLVKYRTSTADFVVDGMPVGGWDRRTFSDLQRAGLTTFTGDRGDRPVRLTKAGERLLEPLVKEHDAPLADLP